MVPSLVDPHVDAINAKSISEDFNLSGEVKELFVETLDSFDDKLKEQHEAIKQIQEEIEKAQAAKRAFEFGAEDDGTFNLDQDGIDDILAFLNENDFEIPESGTLSAHDRERIVVAIQNMTERLQNNLKIESTKTSEIYNSFQQICTIIQKIITELKNAKNASARNIK